MGSERLVKEEEDGVGGDLGTIGSMGWLATEVEEESVHTTKRRDVSLRRGGKGGERTDITIRPSVV